jgi:uncharacterized protein (DUF305 family)
LNPRPIRVAGLTAALLAAGALGATPSYAAAPSGAEVRAYGKHCQGQSKQRVARSQRTPFARCVTAMARLATAKSRSPRIACVGLSRKRVAGTRATAYSRCVSQGARLIRHGNGIDLAFVEDMIPHHVSAVEMAELAPGRARSAFILNLARDIIRSQNVEIATMRRMAARMRAAGIRPVSLGLTEAEAGMDHDASHLVNANPFDVPFAQMMIPHHQGAINMSRVLQRKGVGSATKRLARQITAAQTREIAAMRAFLAQSGAPAPGAGGGGDHADHH